MGRPSRTKDQALKAREASIVRARDRQGRYVAMNLELRDACVAIRRAERDLVRVNDEVCGLHRGDESLCAALRGQNAALSGVA